MDQKEKNALLQNEWMGFNSNIGALYTFFENLSETADKLDQERKRLFAAGLADIFREDREQIEKEVFEYMPSIDDLDIFPDIREDENARETIKIFQDNDFKDTLLAWENKHPHKSYKLSRLLFSLFGNLPISGLILRKSMLITLVTFLEVLLESLFINHFLFQGLNKKEATIEADKYMKGKGGWDKRLNNLDKIGIPSSVFSIHRAEILEIVRLRNLLVHNDGVVDEEYLKHIPEDYQGKLKPGKVLIVSTKRLQRALNKVLVYGLLLCQSHWRLHEGDGKLQNDKIDQFILDSFDKKRYGLILELTENTKALELPENIKQRLLVDRAIAFRELKMFGEVEIIISELKSSKHDWQIDIAISMLSHNYTTLQRLLVSAKNKYDIRKYVHWPLFEPIKNEVWFKVVFIQNRKKVNIPNKRKR